MMKKTLVSIAMTSLLATTAFTSMSVSAVEGLSGNAAATSNYLWRGVEQSAGDSAISGGIDYAADSGFYVGTWASSLGGDSYELDLYAGFGGELSDNISYDVGFIYYAYPDAEGDADFSEVYGSVSFDALTVGLAVLTSSDVDNIDAGDTIYAHADYTFDLGDELELALHLGSYSGDALGDDEYIDYGVSLSKSGFTFGASATDLDDKAGDLKVYVSYSVDIDL
ncbi:MAG: TorF family putative porin [Colwellia sp.]